MSLNELYAKVCMSIVYHVGAGRDMHREAQTATGLLILSDAAGLRRMLAKLSELIAADEN